MEVEIMALCDAATESQGKLNILGAFDHLWTQQFPATHPSCTIALRIRFSRSEQGEHQIRINFADEDGKLIMPSLDGHIHFRCGNDTRSAITNLILQIQQLRLEKRGEYTIDALVDGKPVRSLPLFVKKLEEKS